MDRVDWQENRTASDTADSLKAEEPDEPETTEEPETPETPEAGDLGIAINTAIAALTAQFANKTEGGVKGSVSDLIRLLQLRKELDGERPRQVTVRWIDECENLNGK